MVGVFIDTFVVLTLNALWWSSAPCTLATVILARCGAAASTALDQDQHGPDRVWRRLRREPRATCFVAVCLFFFAFSTILGWNLFGKHQRRLPLRQEERSSIYTILALIFIFLGTMMANDLVWELSDMFNNLMVIPNVIGLLALGGAVAAAAKAGEAAYKAKKKSKV